MHAAPALWHQWGGERKGIWHKADDPSSEQSLPFTTSGGGSRASSMVSPNRGPLLAIAHKQNDKKKNGKKKPWRVVYSERMDETSFFFIYPEPDMWLRSLGPKANARPSFWVEKSLVKASHVLSEVTWNWSVQSFMNRKDKVWAVLWNVAKGQDTVGRNDSYSYK